jgi:NAD(P)-dependent dehydrogenase (short-subunit alcohol dehydrogenase family)
MRRYDTRYAARVPAFAGQVVLITGASAGIGAALARGFAREGARLVLAARRLDRLEALAAELVAAGSPTLAVRCDVTRDGDVEAAAARARAAFGRLDVVVANAGFSVLGDLATLRLEDYRGQAETNVFGVLRTVLATVDDLRQSRGRLVIIGSVSGHVGRPGMSAYAMSKFAVRGFADSIRLELVHDGVSVTLVSPGFVESEIHRVDNRGVFRPDIADPVRPWLRMPADRAARRIIRAVARRRRERAISTLGRAAIFARRHAPWVLPRLVSWPLPFLRSRPPQPPAGFGNTKNE